jgi:cation transporter-like permease
MISTLRSILGTGTMNRFQIMIDELAGIEPWLWSFSVLFFALGDLLTTQFAITTNPLSEGNPVVGWMILNHGLAGFVVLKLAAFVVAYVSWRVIYPPYNVTIPLTLSVMGIGITTWNLFLIGFLLGG